MRRHASRHSAIADIVRGGGANTADSPARGRGEPGGRGGGQTGTTVRMALQGDTRDPIHVCLSWWCKHRIIMHWFQFQARAFRAMAPRRRAKTCQVCWMHRSSWRRQCVRCQCMVAPGCYPDNCLAYDFPAPVGELLGVCRPCAPMHITTTRVRMTCRVLPLALQVFTRSF